MPMKKIALTCGDPAGVGPEIIAAHLGSHPEEAQKLCLIGPSTWLDPLRKKYAVDGLAVGPKNFRALPGSPNTQGALIALEAMHLAAEGCRRGTFRAVVTAPVSKYWLQKTGFRHAGQTEFFAESWGGTPTMAFAGQKLKVALATWHIPLSQVPLSLNLLAASL